MDAPGSARLIDGKSVAAAVIEKVKAARARLIRRLASIPASPSCWSARTRRAPSMSGTRAARRRNAASTPSSTRLPRETSEAELLALVAKLNADPAIHGILVQLPLPKQIDATKVLLAIDPDKDVDGFHPINVGRLALRRARPGAGAVHAGGKRDPRQAGARHRSLRPGGGDRRALQHRRQAGGAASPRRELHRHDLPQPHARPSPPSAGAATSWSRRSGAPEMVKGDWVKPGATASSTSASTACRRRRRARARRSSSATWISPRHRASPARSRRCRAASGR